MVLVVAAVHQQLVLTGQQQILVMVALVQHRRSLVCL
jgi:hypothetical protein